MRKFIDNIIKLLIRIIVFLLMVFVGLLIYAIAFSKQNDIDIEDTITYFKTTGEDIISTVIPSDSSAISKEKILEGILSNPSDSSETSPNISSSTKQFKYYYQQLDSNSKIIYDTIESNIDNLKKPNYTINFSTKFNNLLNSANGQENLNVAFQSALDAFFYDYPELFYIDLTKITLLINSVSIGPKITYKVSIVPVNDTTYLCDGFLSETDIDNAIQKVEKVRSNLINSVSGNSDYEKALQVHNSLVNLLKYDESQNNTHTRNIYGSFIDNNAVVCEGYAKAFKYILDSLNIESILVSGTGTNSSGESESHMWNYIKLDDKWYGVDVTWDDPIVIGNSITKNIIRHTYFCKGSTEFNKSHFASNRISDSGMKFTLPELSSVNFK